ATSGTAIVRIWFVPSRNRFVNGATSASATCLPSGDHVGAPGCGSESWILVTAPVATSTSDISATRHMPSTLNTAMRFPSGDHAGLTMPSTWRGMTDVKSRFLREYIVLARVTVIVAVNGITCASPPVTDLLRILPSET